MVCDEIAHPFVHPAEVLRGVVRIEVRVPLPRLIQDDRGREGIGVDPLHASLRHVGRVPLGVHVCGRDRLDVRRLVVPGMPSVLAEDFEGDVAGGRPPVRDERSHSMFPGDPLRHTTQDGGLPSSMAIDHDDVQEAVRGQTGEDLLDKGLVGRLRDGEIPGKRREAAREAVVQRRRHQRVQPRGQLGGHRLRSEVVRPVGKDPVGFQRARGDQHRLDVTPRHDLRKLLPPEKVQLTGRRLLCG